MNPHLSQVELVEQLYGVGGKEAHVRECAECAGRLEALARTKAQLRSQADSRSHVSGAFLAAQRRAVYARLDQAAASHVRWAPALAGAGLLAMGLFLFPHVQLRAPRTPVPTARVELNTNEQLFSDLYSMEQSVEPTAAAPLHELFEGTAGSEEQ
jgi:predicted anti-sigma-YlaC factor YlaD